MADLFPIFDLDGTLLDSDDALVAPFLALGIERSAIRFGPPVAEECARLGIAVDDYVHAYDPALASPFAGVSEVLAGLDRWALCSNKHQVPGHLELVRYGWTPVVALFTDAFAGRPKRLDPVLAQLGLHATEVLFIGDTAHDRSAAAAVGCRFALAGWNPRAEPATSDLVLADPRELAAALTAG